MFVEAKPFASVLRMAMISAHNPILAGLHKKTKTATIREPSTLNISGEAPMAERLHSRALVTHDKLPRNRRLRNLIIVANAIAWVAIVVLIDLLFL